MAVILIRYDRYQGFSPWITLILLLLFTPWHVADVHCGQYETSIITGTGGACKDVVYNSSTKACWTAEMEILMWFLNDGSQEKLKEALQ